LYIERTCEVPEQQSGASVTLQDRTKKTLRKAGFVVRKIAA
jgi:hypothetical protein